MRKFQDSYPKGGLRAAMAPVAPDYVEDVVMAADTLQRVAVPTGANYVSFSFDGSFRAKFGTAATAYALPGASTSDGSGAELNPAARRIPAGATHVVLRSPDAVKGSLAFWS